MQRKSRPVTSFPIVVTLGLMALLIAAAPAWALRQRTFVAPDPVGNDANAAVDCTLAQPCRTFNVAIPHTTPGGEVVILDTAGYGPMTIDRSIKIIGPSGVYGGISVLGGGGPTTGVVINAGSTDVITLRGLDISGVPGGAPLPLIGINIQSAGAVHIEKSSISNFTDPAGGCIKAASTAPVLVYVDDSMLRECRTGINADGTAETNDGDLVVFVDNTRIELGRATSGPAYGLWVQGRAAATARNSVISIADTAIQVDNINPVLVLSQTQVIGGDGACLNVANSASGSVPVVYIDGSQLLGCNDGIVFTHTASGTPFAAQLKIADSKIQQMSNSAITVTTGADAAVGIDLVRSQLNFTGNTAISLAAGGTSGIGVHVRDSTLSNALTLLKTAGTANVQATLVRSHLHNSFTAVDHGRGRIRLEQTNISLNQKSLVNNGSSNIVSAGVGSNGTNWIVDNADPVDGTVYITPMIIPMK